MEVERGMTMKKILSVILAAVIFASCLGIGAGAELQLQSKNINVTTGIKINVDGAEFIPVDSEGAPVEVFLYNGTTYLPVRGISNLFGLGIEWDNETKSVYLGSRGGQTLPKYSGKADVSTSPFAVEAKNITVFTGASIYYNDEYFVPTGSDGEVVEVFLYNGTTYLPVRAVSNLMNTDIDWDQANKTVLLSTSDYQSVVDAALAAAKVYTDMGTILLPYYQTYLKIATVLTSCAQDVNAAYQQDPNETLEYMLMQYMAAYNAFDKQFGTYMEKAMDFYEFGKTLTKRVETYAVDGYTSDELETLTTNTDYLTSNQTYYSEYIQSSTTEAMIEFVEDSFNGIIVPSVEKSVVEIVMDALAV